MKKVILTLVGFMLVLGMTQCKKEQQPNNTTADDGETVYITMKVADDGGKHIVYPGTGAVVYSDGDVIYVGNNGKYVGSLTYANGAFSGSITNPSTSDYLHFYFTGGKTPATAPTVGSTTSFTVDISDQSSKLPVLSYGHSTTKYIDGTTAYTCMLENKCGLVKFVPSVVTAFPVSVSGMKTTATINFATPGITPTAATGTVTLYSVSDSEKWAILLPQNEVENPQVSVVNKIATIESVPAIIPNMYYSTGVAITVGVPTGAVAGTFTINANGDKVWFSKGNLRYKATSVSWRFAEHQYDCVGNGNLNISENYDGWIDLFGWGTSGFNHGAVCYAPWSTSYLNKDYYAYGGGKSNLYEQTGKADWGYNMIDNGGVMYNQWRTLTYYEWSYLLYSRSDELYGHGCVNGTNGFILLPDIWTLPDGLSFTSGKCAYTTNTYTVDQWTQMEANGAVFFPAAGVREVNNDGSMEVDQINSGGFYWLPECNPSNMEMEQGEYVYAFAYDMVIKNNHIRASDGYRHDGMSVRLVKNVE